MDEVVGMAVDIFDLPVSIVLTLCKMKPYTTRLPLVIFFISFPLFVNGQQQLQLYWLSA